MRYIPHTEADIARMLHAVGKPSVESLFAHIPDSLRAKRPLDIEPLDEGALLAHLGQIGAASQPAVGAVTRAGERPVLSFLGCGLVPHTIPSSVDMMLQRSEWYTSYTPYQPEISQGTLQAVFEFQTMVAEILGLGVANASMYDGASAAAEAVLMAQRVTGRRRAIVAGAVHPHTVRTIHTFLSAAEGPAHDALLEVPVGADGRTDAAALERALADAGADVACVVVQTPSFFGTVEDLTRLGELAHAKGALFVVANAEPLAFGVLAPPGALGADIAVAEGIGLATPPSGGGPGVGLFAARADLVRQLPGRLVGETVDKEGRRGYVLTLATREQHIRREKATSNICTNQGLIALAFTIHMSLLGKRGFTELARLCLARTEYAKGVLAKVPGVKLAFSAPTFDELALALPGDAEPVVERLAARGIFAGVPATAPGLLDGPEHAKWKNLLLVAITERHGKADIDRLAQALAEEVRQ